MTPKVSIGLPVRNGEAHVAEALASLLGQTCGDFELIISDNASTDSTPGICARAAASDRRVRYQRLEQNCGAVGNFNRLAREARGKYFMWAAHDDLWDVEFLARCVAELDANPQLALCHTAVQPISDATGLPCGNPQRGMSCEAASPRLRWRHALEHWEIHGAIYGVMRFDALARTHLIPARLSGDLIFMAELSLFGGIRQLPEVLQSKRAPAAGRHYESARAMAAYMGARVLPPFYLHRFATAVQLSARLLAVRPRPAECVAMLRDTWAVYLNRGQWLVDVKEAGKEVLAASHRRIRSFRSA